MFCTVKKLEHLGVGKLVDVTENQCTVEYFDSPEKSPEIHCVAQTRVARKILGHNVRVYYHDPTTNYWVVGRVIEEDDSGVYVRFTDHNDVYLAYNNVFVRWKKPISDPTAYLANLIIETPQYSQARSNFLDSYIDQRCASWGLSGLMSSVIELESHQINVVRRVLNDASQRYLLADEVGLGKTIEAGVLIRQAVLDDPQGHRVIVLVPASLVQQWRGELTRRFGLEEYLDESVFVYAQELSGKLIGALVGTTLLVIDEAHHIASGTDGETRKLYDLIAEASIKIDRLLLLSATPVIRNESGFLRMLHLLDPVVYNLSDEESFRAKVQHRQTLAETVAMLDPQNVLYLDTVLDDLLKKLPGDERLTELVNALQAQLVGMPDEDDIDLCESIRLLRAHLSETYRLHRRILRNRRKQVSGLTPERYGSNSWTSQCAQISHLESLLESWRINAVATTFQDADETKKIKFQQFYWESISALLQNPERLLTLCQGRLVAITEPDEGNVTFDEEKSLLEEIISQIDIEEWYHDRLKCLETGVKKLLPSRTKMVVFCSSKESADKAFSHLRFSFGSIILRHQIVQGAEMGPDSASEFITNADINVIVCDHTAEEGINLQGGNKTVIHFDLPIEPNRVEQRMGRVDRYGSGSPVKSVNILDENSIYQKTWYSVLNDGLGVFDRSISSLQYLVEDELKQLKVQIFNDGVEAMSELATKLGGSSGAVAKELKLIDQQDGLDELSPLAESETESISDCDSEWKSIRQAAMSWIVDTLMFGQVDELNTQAPNTKDPPFRFKYQKPGAGGIATLIPLSGFLDDFLGVIDLEPMRRRRNAHTPLSYPHSAYRTTAINRGVRLLRYGDEFIEAVKSFSDLDDRGRSYAMWRQFYDEFSENREPQMCFRFDFLVESRLDDAVKVLEKSSSRDNDSARSILARRGDALFPPSVAHVWLDEEGEELDQEKVDKYLAVPYAKHGEIGRYIDKNLKLRRFLSLQKAMPDKFANWSDRCRRMRDSALNILLLREELLTRKKTAIKRAQTEDEIRYAQLSTRIRHLDGKEAESERAQLELEKKINEALYNGIRTPSIKVDVVGTVFLSNQPFSEIEQATEALI